MYKLVLIRHGESLWNKAKNFSGWSDVDLTEKGKEEAILAGKILLQEGFLFDIAFTSVLKRAIRTLWLVLDELNSCWIPVERTWHLNERHYGALQGLNKIEMSYLCGEKRVKDWRRKYDEIPPPLNKFDERHPRMKQCYHNLSEDLIPSTESLKNVITRVTPYWKNIIIPKIRSGKNVLIVAHHNSLKAIVKDLDNISDKDIPSYEMPTGIPLIYLIDQNMKAIRHYYLGDPKMIKRAIEDEIHLGELSWEKDFKSYLTKS
ncbi:2,3-diphosphoglycerate-dependent phosphoglycerate mutase [Promethearchaeum syntrophicum]|uniref:2,3-bisphosphoglycerate-dependent phosphoglycerate mutase n=1 Tax=Promethearchaeum syntrophicum TaxID=2594042 RepID=A0A5B9DDI2_9ARCH|nr:2,3-diphosphoglycerate-dependent phosphoglycerate mutase [Candidatus Prometheoarchaeum syntrophicum]